MDKFPMLVFAFGLPLLGFMFLKDGSATIFKSSSSGPSGYQIDVPDRDVDVPEPEEAEVANAEPVEETSSSSEGTAEEQVIGNDDEDANNENVASETTTETATEDDVASDSAPEPTSVTAALSEEEMNAAKRAVRVCTSCHQLERERNTVGPHLVGVVGRTIGSVEGYKYSDALVALGAEGQVWTRENLVDWLAEPTGFADGTKMNFKVNDADSRRLIAGYLVGR